MPTATQKLPTVGPSVFAYYTQLAQQHGAVNLGQGFPDFAPDPRLLAHTQAALAEGHNQYAPLAGVLALREQLAALYSAAFGAVYDPLTEITVTSGATEAIFSLLQALVGPGDEVIYFEPAYDSYRPGIALAGATPVALPLALPSGQLDPERLAEAVNPRTRAILVNTPHNPTGTVLSRASFAAVAEVAERHNLLVISDEVYAWMHYDGQPYVGVGSFPALRERALLIGSFGKCLHATGWKLGYVMAPAHLTQELQKVHQFVTFAGPTPLQVGIARFLAEVPTFFTELASLFEAKRNFLQAELAGTGLEPQPCGGTYFQCVAAPGRGQMTDTELAHHLVAEARVAALPLSPFVHTGASTGLLRLCFAKQEATLAEAGARLRAWAQRG